MDLLALTLDNIRLLAGFLGVVPALVAAASSRFPATAPLLGALLVTALA